MTQYGKWIKERPDEVDQKETGLSAWYKAVWSRLGGRPFTYVIRDWWHQYPLVWIFGFIGLAGLLVFLTLIFGDSGLYRVVMFSLLGAGGFLFFLGTCLGHLFWS